MSKVTVRDIPVGTPVGLRRFFERLIESVEVTTAQRGSPLDAQPTFRDLIESGVIKVDPNSPLYAGGRQFTVDEMKNWLSSTVPQWVTDSTNPPTPTGLVVLQSDANLVLVWTAPVFSNYKQTLIYRSTTNNLSTAQLVGSNTGNTYPDELPPSGQQFYYWIRHESKSELLSDFNDVNGTTVADIPAAPSVSVTFEGEEIVIQWTTPTSNLTIQYYIVSHGASPGANAVGTSQSNALRFKANFLGARKFWVQAVNINNAVGNGGSFDATILAPGAPIISQGLVNGALALSYSSAPGSLPIAYYELAHTADFGNGSSVALGQTISTRREFTVNWLGSRTFYVRAVDTAGNPSDSVNSVFNLVTPTVISPVAEVIDNNVLLRWSVTPGTLPVLTYRVYRNGVLVGTDAALFATLFESESGSFTYKIEPLDTAGNVGTFVEVVVAVSQPPDFILFDRHESDKMSLLKALGYHCSFPGSTGNHLSTPDSSALDITGDIDIRLRVNCTDWTPASAFEFIDKIVNDTTQFSYLLRLDTTGTLRLYWTTDGSTLINRVSTVATGFTDGTTHWIRAVLDVSIGGNHEVKFYTSEDYDPDTNEGTWTQLGTTVSTAGTTSIFSGTAELQVAGGRSGVAGFLAGKVYYAEVRNGIDGTKAAVFDARDAKLTEINFFSSATAEMWTVNGTAVIKQDLLKVSYDYDTGILYANVEANETFSERFSTRGWSTLQDQIDDGYPLWHVGKTTGHYEEVMDYRATIPSTKITLTPTKVFESGTVGITPNLKHSTDNVSYTDLGNVYSGYASGFRYVKYRMDFAADANGTGLGTDTSELIGLKPITHKLDVKLKTHQGVVTCNSGDSGGTSVDITGIFIDVQSINVTPYSTTAKHPTVDFTDTPNPTSFKVLLWDAAGVRASGDAAYSIRGV